MELKPDTEPLPGYRLKRHLGKGGFGSVWEALAPNGNSVALKFIDTRFRDLRLIQSESAVLRTLNQLNHPNLIRLFDVFARSPYLVLCMERADGSLEELRQAYREETHGNIPPDHALELLEQAAEGLDYLAQMRLPGFSLTALGMQHCDVKPSNLLLMGDTVKVADFGLCAGVGHQSCSRGMRGTPPFAAPEMYQGRVNDRTDQYSLAVTFCDLVASSRMFHKNAFTAGGPIMGVDLTRARKNEAPVLARALHEDSTRRYPSCKAFVTALRDAIKKPRRASGRWLRTMLRQKCAREEAAPDAK
jgi:serine/threonine protein kinase